MKKIMFDDKYGLTKAVLEGRKTMTRRVMPELVANAIDSNPYKIHYADFAPYKVGEVVAVAQSYMDAGYDPHMLQFIDIKEPTILPFSDGLPVLGYVEAPIMYHAGWMNKMFVHPTMMPHQIRITNIEVERLKDISFDSALKEGLVWEHNAKKFCVIKKRLSNGMCVREWLGTEYKEAFAALIDKVSGKGTWKSNPWVFVYEFELVK